MLKLKELKVVVSEDGIHDDTYHVMQKHLDVKLSKSDTKILRRFLMKMGMGASVLGDFDETG